MKKFNKKEWEQMKEGIDEKEAHAKDFWGFECLKDSTNLQWDIGTEVYFAWGIDVFKGTVVRINCHSMCGIRFIPDVDGTITYIATKELYTNVRYALKKAEHTYNMRMINETKLPQKEMIQ